MIPQIIGLFIVFLCWGSFLNVVGYRLIRHYPLTGRSFCPHCRQTLSWYDLIPLVSYITLQGRCRYCGNSISFLYPFIEVVTALLLTCMILFIDRQYWLGYGIFISALLVTIRTDFDKMLISRLVTLALIPIAVVLSFFTMIPVLPQQSILGALFGYSVLWIIAKVFYLIKKNEGMGDGDFDLLSMIGSFTGILGAWIALLLGSFLGVLASIVHMIASRRIHIKIAFGPWLAAGALLYLFFQDFFLLMFDHINTF